MSQPAITVYGAYWCPDCRRAKKFLGEQFVQYNWVDIEQDKTGEDYVLTLNNGKRIIPTVVFEDGSFLVEPSNAELAQKLDLQTEARMTYYDLVIIGGGPAGLTAAIYAAREGVETLLIERSGLGGQAGITGAIEISPDFRRVLAARSWPIAWCSRPVALTLKSCKRRISSCLPGTTGINALRIAKASTSTAKPC